MGGQVSSVLQMVCLANSRKGGDRCVAGMEFGSKKWVRPISRRPNEAVSATERQYSDRSEPRILDIVSMGLIEKRPSKFQRENWLIDHTVQWVKVGRIDWDGLCGLEQQPEELWINGYSSWGRLNNKIPASRQGEIASSLALIRVESVIIGADGFARFEHMGHDYIINLTDPVYEEMFKTKGVLRKKLGESFITVSLGKEWDDGYLYKFVAAIIERSEIESDGRR